VRKLKSVQAAIGALERSDPFRRLPYDSEREIGAWLSRKLVAQLEDLARRGRDAGFAVIAVVMPCKQDLVEGDRAIYGDLAERLAAAGLAHVDAGRVMRERGVAGGEVFFARDWHLNADGNRMLAAIVAEAILAADAAGASEAAAGRSP
jgi:hypothetical protein